MRVRVARSVSPAVAIFTSATPIERLLRQLPDCAPVRSTQQATSQNFPGSLKIAQAPHSCAATAASFSSAYTRQHSVCCGCGNRPTNFSLGIAKCLRRIGGIAFGAAVSGLVANASGLSDPMPDAAVLRAAFWVPAAIVVAPLAAIAIGTRLNALARWSARGTSCGDR